MSVANDDEERALLWRSYPSGIPAFLGGLVALSLSHRLSLKPPVAWAGAVPITGQTLAVCINALMLQPSTSVTAVSAYIFAGLIGGIFPAGFLGTTAANWIGPPLTKKGVGYIFGMLPGTMMVCFSAQLLWPSASTPTLDFLGAFGACVCGQATVILCGAGWIGEFLKLSTSQTLRVAVWPYLPGLLIKASLAAMLAVLYAHSPSQ